jgi:hypothetical protein
MVWHSHEWLRRITNPHHYPPGLHIRKSQLAIQMVFLYGWHLVISNQENGYLFAIKQLND